MEGVVTTIDNLVTRSDRRGMVSLLRLLGGSPITRAAQAIDAAKQPLNICTGFPVNHKPETDGPAGAVVLAHALVACGKQVRIASFGQVLDLVWPLLPAGVEAAFVPAGQKAMPFQDGATITIEACGETPTGPYLNMNGLDIRAVAPWFETACGTHCLVSLGDGGNEFGMGSAPDTWYSAAGRGVVRPIATCDVLVPAEVSNWGALGIVAQLSLMHGTTFLPTPTTYVQLLEDLVHRGAIDGVTEASTPTEDGKTQQETMQVVEGLQSWLANKAP